MHVLNHLKEYGLKLSEEKCTFLQTSVRYLGHIVSQNGMESDSQKIETIKTWASPKSLKELCSFLGISQAIIAIASKTMPRPQNR